MRKATREVTIAALIVAAIALATGTARLFNHKVDYLHAPITADAGRH